MTVSFHKYQVEDLCPFYIGTNDDAPDVYTDWIRTGQAGDSKTAFITRVCGPGTKFIDLGANIGLYTLPAAAAGAKVLAVEGLPANYSVLLHSIVRNHFRNVTAVHAAVFETTGILHMHGNSAWGCVSLGPTSIQVPSITVDDLCGAYDFWDVKLMKIDIEGSEIFAFNGASKLLQENKDLMIIFENNVWGCWNFKHRLRDLLKRVEDCGFDLYLFHDTYLIPRTAKDYQESVFVDYLAVRRGVIPRIPGFEIRELSSEERADIVLHQAEVAQFVHRAYILGTQATMPVEIRKRPEVESALQRLQNDTNEEFLSAVQCFAQVV